MQADSAAGRSQLARPQQQRAAYRGGPLRKADGRFMSREEVRAAAVLAWHVLACWRCCPTYAIS